MISRATQGTHLALQLRAWGPMSWNRTPPQMGHGGHTSQHRHTQLGHGDQCPNTDTPSWAMGVPCPDIHPPAGPCGSHSVTQTWQWVHGGPLSQHRPPSWAMGVSVPTQTPQLDHEGHILSYRPGSGALGVGYQWFSSADGKGTGWHWRCRALPALGSPLSTPHPARALVPGRCAGCQEMGQAWWWESSAGLGTASLLLGYCTFPKGSLKAATNIPIAQAFLCATPLSPGWLGMPHKGQRCKWDRREECKDKEFYSLCTAHLHKTSGVFPQRLYQLFLAQKVSLRAFWKVLA